MKHAKLVIAYLLGMSIISLSVIHSQQAPEKVSAMSLNAVGPPVLWSAVVPVTTTSTTQPAPTTTEPQPASPPPTQPPRTTQPPTTDPPPDTTPVETPLETEVQTQDNEAAPESGNDVVGIIHEVFGSSGDKATRVANCESTLNPSAVSPGGGNWGLFQINTVHKNDFESFTGVSWSDGILDARLNSQYAYKLFSEQGWGPWSCGRA
jgi:hypothetical protein